MQSGNSSLTSWPDVKLIPQTNKLLPSGNVRRARLSWVAQRPRGHFRLVLEMETKCRQLWQCWVEVPLSVFSTFSDLLMVFAAALIALDDVKALKCCPPGFV